MDKDILIFIKKFKNRKWLINIIEFFIKGFMISSIFPLIVALISLFIPIVDDIKFQLIFLIFGIFISIILGFINRPTTKAIASLIDKNANLKERTQTYVEFIGKEDGIYELQREDTLNELKKVDIKKSFPIRVNYKYLIISAVCLILIIGVNFIPTVSKIKAKEIEALKIQKKKEEEKVLKIEQDKDTNLKEEIEQFKEEVESAKTMEELKKVSERFDRKLEKKDDEKLIDEYLKVLEELSKSDVKTLEKLAEAMKDMKIDEEKLDEFKDMLKNLSKEDLKKLSEAVKSIAEKLSKSDLKDAMNSLSEDALDNEVSSSFSSSMDKLNSSISKAQKNLNKNNSNNTSTANNNNNSQNNNQGNSNSQGQNQGQGSSQNQGQGQGQGQGSGQTTGQNQGLGRGRGHVDLAEEEKLFIPSGTLANDEELKGQKNDEGEKQIIKTENSQMQKGEYQNYKKAVGEYEITSMDRIDRIEVPSNMKEIIKQYFNSLNQED